MTEQIMGVTEARQNLLQLCKRAKERLGRTILVNKGKPVAVLLGIADYKSLKAEVELLQELDVLCQTYAAMDRLDRGEGLSLKELKNLLRKRRNKKKRK